VPSTKVAGDRERRPAEGVLRTGDQIVAVDGRRASVDSIINAVNAHRCAARS